MEKIAIYNENSTMAGRRNYHVEITADGRALNENGSENGDSTVFDVNQEEIERAEKMVDASGAGTDLFWLRVANTLRENL